MQANKCLVRIVPTGKSGFAVQEKGLVFWTTCRLETGTRIMDHVETKDAIFDKIEDARELATSLVQKRADDERDRVLVKDRKASTPIEYFGF